MAKTRLTRPLRCPRCEFQYAWDGRFCNHCHFPHAKRSNWDEFQELVRFSFAHPEPDERKLRLFGCACLREVLPYLPATAVAIMALLEDQKAPYQSIVAMAQQTYNTLANQAAIEQREAATALLSFAQLFVPPASIDRDASALRDGVFGIAARVRTAHAAAVVPQVNEERILTPMFMIERSRRLHDEGPPPPLTDDQQDQLDAYQRSQRIAREVAQQRRVEADEHQQRHCHLYRDIFRYPFSETAIHPGWFSSTVQDLARWMDGNHDYSAMPILSDALQDAGCDDEEIIAHCVRPVAHVRGCWVVDLILGRG